MRHDGILTPGDSYATELIERAPYARAADRQRGAERARARVET